MALTWLCDLTRQLQYVAMPMTDWITKSAENPAYAGLTFLQEIQRQMKNSDLTDAFAKGLEICGQTDGFLKEDIVCLKLLGEHLGKSDTSTQMQYVGECAAALTQQHKKAGEEAAKADKLYLTLGASGGLAVAILLL